jgi:hypothetical protein
MLEINKLLSFNKIRGGFGPLELGTSEYFQAQRIKTGPAI